MIAAFLLAACSCTSLKEDSCTAENVVRALELAKKHLAIVDECVGCMSYSEGNFVLTTPSSHWNVIGGNQLRINAEAREKRREAEKLSEEAEALEQKGKDFEFILKVLEACKE